MMTTEKSGARVFQHDCSGCHCIGSFKMIFLFHFWFKVLVKMGYLESKVSLIDVTLILMGFTKLALFILV